VKKKTESKKQERKKAKTMGDLEESMFKRNIPGKYSRWAEEDDDFRRGNHEDEEDHENEANEPQDPV
jgi:hypothetical protein